jgi:hypothetical protein
MVKIKHHQTTSDMSGCKTYGRTDMRNEIFEIDFERRVLKYEINRWKQVV